VQLFRALIPWCNCAFCGASEMQADSFMTQRFVCMPLRHFGMCVAAVAVVTVTGKLWQLWTWWPFSLFYCWCAASAQVRIFPNCCRGSRVSWPDLEPRPQLKWGSRGVCVMVHPSWIRALECVASCLFIEDTPYRSYL